MCWGTHESRTAAVARSAQQPHAVDSHHSAGTRASCAGGGERSPSSRSRSACPRPSRKSRRLGHAMRSVVAGESERSPSAWGLSSGALLAAPRPGAWSSDRRRCVLEQAPTLLWKYCTRARIRTRLSGQLHPAMRPARDRFHPFHHGCTRMGCWPCSPWTETGHRPDEYTPPPAPYQMRSRCLHFFEQSAHEGLRLLPCIVPSCLEP